MPNCMSLKTAYHNYTKTASALSFSLINAKSDKRVYESAGFDFLCVPVKKFLAPPNAEQFKDICNFMDTCPKPLIVCCEGGLGKTGTILAAWLIYQGESPQQAIQKVRAIEAGAIESNRSNPLSGKPTRHTVKSVKNLLGKQSISGGFCALDHSLHHKSARKIISAGKSKEMITRGMNIPDIARLHIVLSF